jgi:diamine N-acetyltransferase
MGITLRKVNMENFHQCLALELAPDQNNFVASNIYSLAEAKADGVSVPLAIYAGEDMVGFIMYWYDDKNGKGYIDRLMVDRRHQRKGYGRAAMLEVIDILKRNSGIRGIQVSFAFNNINAEKLYASLGFRKTNRTTNDGEEIITIFDI